MRNIAWNAAALDDLENIIGYIADHDVKAAVGMHNLIIGSVQLAAAYPFLYKSGRVFGTREIVVHRNYVIVYTVQIDHVEVISVLHARQEYP